MAPGDVVLRRGGLESSSPTARRQAFVDRLRGRSGGGIVVRGSGRKIRGGGVTDRERKAAARKRAAAEARRKAEEAAKKKAREEAARLERESRQRLLELQRVNRAKNIRRQDRGVVTFQDIEKQRRRIMASGGKSTTSFSRDIRTGNILRIRDFTKGGRTVREVIDTETGKITINFFSPGTTGTKRFRKGVSVNGDKKSLNVKEKKTETTLKEIPIKPIKLSPIEKGVDVITGGRITFKRITTRQDKLDKDIEDFNAKFGDRELTPAEGRTAMSKKKRLDKRQRAIDSEIDKLRGTSKLKLGDLILGIDVTGAKLEKSVEQRTKELPKKERELKKVQKGLKNIEGKRDIFSRLNRARLKAIEKGLKQDIKDTKGGKPIKILKGDLPLIPASKIPSTVTAIKFIGKQKTGKGGKIITDLVFKTNKGREGVAKGVTIAKGKNSATVSLGRSGKKVFRLPSGKRSFRKFESFISVEKGKAVPSVAKIRTNINLLRGKKNIGRINKIKENIKIVKQTGFGKIATAKGKKLVKGGKRIKGIPNQDFASVSAILTKKDLSLIVGKTITRESARAKFVGVIKGTTGAKGKVSGATQQQFQKALSQVASQVSAALSKAKKMGFTGKEKYAAAASIVSKGTSSIKSAKVRTLTRTSQVSQSARQIPSRKIKVKTRTRVMQKSRPKTKQRTLQRAKQKSKSRTKLKSAQRLRQGLRQKQALRSKQAQRLKLKSKATGRGRVPSPRVTIPKIPPVIKSKKKKKKVMKKKSKKVVVYDVFAKPVKGRKLIKVNKVPLSKVRATDVRNYLVDTSLSRTGKIKARKVKGIPKRGILKVPIGYGRRTSRKFREFRIVKKVRKPLRKGKVIERRKRLLDTKQEKKKITLRKRLKQVTPKTKRKVRRKKK